MRSVATACGVLRLNAALGPLQALAVDAAAPVKGVVDERLRGLVRVAEGGTPE